ncbi:MAG: cysteine desulfurase [Parcubacteria group bacterium]|nr:cysteine desulfurase [Parcubacteria group bacterium]
MVYLDYSASTPIDPRVSEHMRAHEDIFGNPSSVHAFGRKARVAIEEARDAIASLINAKPLEIIFTSSGTEANNFALKGVVWEYRKKRNHIVTSAIEHASILESCEFLKTQGYKITYLKPHSNGIISEEKLVEALTRDTILVSIMLVNNEIGTIEPIQQLASIAHQKNILFHTDAVQATSYLPIDVKKLGVDLLTLSSHKIYGPKGVGALYAREGVKFSPLLHGGDQEMKRRASTENTLGIIGFGKAAELIKKEQGEQIARLKKLKDYFVEELIQLGARINGDQKNSAPHIINATFARADGRTLIIKLDMEGIAASMGSACHSGSINPSHVLLAIGKSKKEALSSLRFSFGKQTTKKELEQTITILKNILK